MSAYEEAVNDMVYKVSWLHHVRCTSCGLLLGSSTRSMGLEDLLCKKCTIECIDILASEADEDFN